MHLLACVQWHGACRQHGSAAQRSPEHSDSCGTARAAAWPPKSRTALGSGASAQPCPAGPPGAGQSRETAAFSCFFFSTAMLLVALLTRTANFCTPRGGALIHQSCKGGEEVKMEEATRTGVEGPESIVNLLNIQQYKNYWFFKCSPHPILRFGNQCASQGLEGERTGWVRLVQVLSVVIRIMHCNRLSLTARRRRCSSSSNSRSGGSGIDGGKSYMGWARNIFYIVVLAHDGRLSPEGSLQRGGAGLECVNYVHLQRTRE